jgi:hypothetical protein
MATTSNKLLHLQGVENTLLARVTDDPPRIKRHKRLIREAGSGHVPDSAR